MIGSFEQNKHLPWIVAVASIHSTHTLCESFLTMSTRLVLGLFVLYDSFPQLRTGLRGCTYCWQHLTVVTVSLVRITLSSSRWCLQAYQRNKRRPWIIAAQNGQWKSSSHGVRSKKFGKCDANCYVDPLTQHATNKLSSFLALTWTHGSTSLLPTVEKRWWMMQASSWHPRQPL